MPENDLIEYVKTGDFAGVQNAVRAGGCSLEARDKESLTALLWACRRGHTEIALFLLAQGADVSALDNKRRGVWHYAAMSLADPRFLLPYSADISARDGNGWTPLHWASRSGNLTAMAFLIEKGTSIDEKGRSKDTPLHYAAGFGGLEATRLLIENGADIREMSDKGVTPLMMAAAKGTVETARFLMTCGANVRARDTQGQTCLHACASIGASTSVDMVRFLMDAGLDPNDEDERGITPFERALYALHPALARAMYERGAKPTRDMLHRCLGRAMQSAHLETALFLIELGAKPSHYKKRYGKMFRELYPAYEAMLLKNASDDCAHDAQDSPGL